MTQSVYQLTCADNFENACARLYVEFTSALAAATGGKVRQYGALDCSSSVAVTGTAWTDTELYLLSVNRETKIAQLTRGPLDKQAPQQVDLCYLLEHREIVNEL